MLAVFAKVTITQLNARTAFLFRSIRSFRDLLSGPAFNCLYCIFFLFVENLSTIGWWTILKHYKVAARELCIKILDSISFMEVL